MNRQQIADLVLSQIAAIAPEADLSSLDHAADLRDQVELDSMDILNLATGLSKALAIDIPELDYPRLATVDSAVAYLQIRAG